MHDLKALFEEQERLLLVSPAVVRFRFLKRRLLEHEGHIRVRAELAGGGSLEFSEYWNDVDGEPTRREYVYHWQNAQGQLVRRWDNAGHYLRLPHAPHHVHLTDDQIEGIAPPPDLAAVLAEIEQSIKGTQ